MMLKTSRDIDFLRASLISRAGRPCIMILTWRDTANTRVSSHVPVSLSQVYSLRIMHGRIRVWKCGIIAFQPVWSLLTKTKTKIV